MTTARLYPIVEKRLGGYIDRDGAVVVAPQYKFVDVFHDGLGRVKGPKGFGYIDATGAEVIAPTIAEAHWFVDGLAKAKRGKAYGYIGRDGAFAIAPRFGQCEAFHEGFAIAQDAKTLLHGVIDRHGDWVIAPRERGDLAFFEGLAARVDPATGRFGYVDATDRFVIDARFDWAEPFSEGLARVDDNGTGRFIDREGRVVIAEAYGPLDGNELNAFKEGLALVSLPDSTYGYLDRQGALAISARPGRAANFREGRAVAGSDDDPNSFTKWGYIDARGEYVVRPVLYNAGHFEGGLARAHADRKREHVYGYIDRDGRWVWQPAGGFAPEMQDLRP
ncbi:MAG: WG repeat-containing protein [Deltaproteobacteria bacterium]|jgi:hypothetical protein|nr:WG repeat-containing protein [Deltaproteobacteria bacterium]